MSLRTLLTHLAPPLAVATCFGVSSAHDFVPAPSPRADIELICGGSACPEVNHHGQRYVVGERGQRYELALSNPSDRWVEAVVTVDGRNILDGQRPHSRSRGYLIPPRDSVRIEGWRTSYREVAAFRFTSVGDSYAGRVGDGHAAGVIRLEVYPEQRRRHWIPDPHPRPLEEPGFDKARESRADGAAAEDGFAPSPRPHSHGWHEQNLGTQFGESRWQPVQERDFVRESQRPARVVTLRYDDRHALGARGILPDTAWRPPVRWTIPPSR